jgi:hypothetical protein
MRKIVYALIGKDSLYYCNKHGTLFTSDIRHAHKFNKESTAQRAVEKLVKLLGTGISVKYCDMLIKDREYYIIMPMNIKPGHKLVEDVNKINGIYFGIESLYSVTHIHGLLKEAFSKGSNYITVGGTNIKITSKYHVHIKNNFTCISCGMQGVVYRKEADYHKYRNQSYDNTKFHLNLYGIDSKGKYHLMTIDHIIPKSIGGQNELINYQCMCESCNKEKGNDFNIILELSNGEDLVLQGLSKSKYKSHKKKMKRFSRGYYGGSNNTIKKYVNDILKSTKIAQLLLLASKEGYVRDTIIKLGLYDHERFNSIIDELRKLDPVLRHAINFDPNIKPFNAIDSESLDM